MNITKETNTINIKFRFIIKFPAIKLIGIIPIKRLIKKKKAQQEEHQKIKDYAESINEETRNNKEK